jgi:hypothetical protein
VSAAGRTRASTARMCRRCTGTDGVSPGDRDERRHESHAPGPPPSARHRPDHGSSRAHPSRPGPPIEHRSIAQVGYAGATSAGSPTPVVRRLEASSGPRPENPQAIQPSADGLHRPSATRSEAALEGGRPSGPVRCRHGPARGGPAPPASRWLPLRITVRSWPRAGSLGQNSRFDRTNEWIGHRGPSQTIAGAASEPDRVAMASRLRSRTPRGDPSPCRIERPRPTSLDRATIPGQGPPPTGARPGPPRRRHRVARNPPIATDSARLKVRRTTVANPHTRRRCRRGTRRSRGDDPREGGQLGDDEQPPAPLRSDGLRLGASAAMNRQSCGWHIRWCGDQAIGERRRGNRPRRSVTGLHCPAPAGGDRRASAGLMRPSASAS